MKDISMKNQASDTGHKERLDSYLVRNGFAHSRTVAHTLIDSELVSVNNEIVTKRNRIVKSIDVIAVKIVQTFVGRGAEKLLYALGECDILVQDKICLDIGSSTGGFTEVLLEKGAKVVYAVDVGSNQLDKRLLSNERVISMEGTDIREVENFSDEINLIVCDVSFVSLRYILPVLKKFCSTNAELLLLVKPQFEVGKELIGKKGIVKEKSAQILALLNIATLAGEDFRVVSAIESFPRGKTGNLEYFLHLGCI